MSKFSEKVITIIFGVLILLLPVQTRLILFLPESHDAGSFIFYNVLFLYLTDIILVFLLLLWAFLRMFPVKQTIFSEQVEQQGSVSHETQDDYKKIRKKVSRENKPISIMNRFWGIVSYETIIWLFFGVSCVTLFVSRETIGSWDLAIFGLFKLFLVILLFSFTRNISSKQIPLYKKRRTDKSTPLSSLISGTGEDSFLSFTKESYKENFEGTFPVKQGHDISEKWGKIWIFWLILATSLFQGILGLIQFFTQKSLGLKLLGEEVVRNYIPGIAKFEIFGGFRWIFDDLLNVSHGTSLLIRPYGTFPHPNVFGAFMFFSVIISYYLYVSCGTRARLLLSLSLFIQIFAGAISFSRVAIVAFGISTVVWFMLVVFTGNNLSFFPFVRGRSRSGHKRNDNLVPAKTSPNPSFARRGGRVLVLVIFSTLTVVAILFFPQFLERTGIVSHGTTNKQAISERILYQQAAIEMIKQKPLTGVGYKNFVMIMDEYSPRALKPYQHQPVHNIYLLIAAETGIFGLILFLSFIILIVKSAWKDRYDPLVATLLSIFIGFLFIGLFDHYLLTIQQGRLMFFLTAGLLTLNTKRAKQKNTQRRVCQVAR